MSVTKATDLDLRSLLFAHDMVIVMYYSDECENCKALKPVYRKLSNLPSNKGIHFLSIKAAEGIVASKIVKESGNSFLVIYKKGFLIRCDEVITEKELKTIIKELKDEVRPIFIP